MPAPAPLFSPTPGQSPPEETEREDHEIKTVDGGGSQLGDPAERDPRPPSEARLQAYLDQVLLRVFCASPGLASYVESSRVVPESGTVELSFFKVPDEVVSAIFQAFAVAKVETLRYTKAGSACLGFRATPSREDLAALQVDDQEAGNEPEKAADGLEGGTTRVAAQADRLLRAPGQPSAT